MYSRVQVYVKRLDTDKSYADRLERILTMVYVVQNCLTSFGLYPSSGMVCGCYKKTTYQTMDRVQKKPNSSVLTLCRGRAIAQAV
jgi:hypothetical protein